jgi:hypothetical protein
LVTTLWLIYVLAFQQEVQVEQTPLTTLVTTLWLFFVLAIQRDPGRKDVIDTNSVIVFWPALPPRLSAGGPGRTDSIDTTAVTVLWLLYVLASQQEVQVEQWILTRQR